MYKSRGEVPKQFMLVVQTVCARPEDDLYLVNSILVLAQCWHKKKTGNKCNSIFSLAQNIWTDPKHFGTCRRTRHKCSQIFGLAQNIWTSTKHFGTCKRTRHKTQELSKSKNSSICSILVSKELKRLSKLGNSFYEFQT